MAVRTPLKLNGSNLQQMTSAEIDLIKDQVRYLYGASPSVTLSRVASGGDLGTISDTRKSAGAYSTRVDRYPTEAETAEPGTVTVNYSRIEQSGTTLSAPSFAIRYPLYYSGGNLYEMSLTDMYDTFIYPAIDTLTNGSDQPGTYRIHTATSLTNHTAVSTSTVFSDTRANTGAYTAGGIPEALDQPTTITNFYLLKTNAGSAVSYTRPVYANPGNDIQQYATSGFDNILQTLVRYVAMNVTGSRIRYNINGTGNNRGSGMTNTILNGSGNYQTRFVNADDYRAQEFPDGSAVTAATYYLRIYQV